MGENESFRLAVLVVAAALIDASGRVLMQQRPRGKAHAGLWEFPGGKVEPGENPAGALVRELEEELAVVVGQADLRPLTFAADASVALLLYTCCRWSGSPEPREAAALRWDTPARLADLPMPPLDVPLVTALSGAVPSPHRP